MTPFGVKSRFCGGDASSGHCEHLLYKNPKALFGL